MGVKVGFIGENSRLIPIYEKFRRKILIYEKLRRYLPCNWTNAAAAALGAVGQQNREIMKPTDSELEILHLLWEMGPSTVRAVNERLNTRREVGYTTTLKMMQIMFEKGLVTRVEEGRTHSYAAAVKKDDTQSLLLQDFVDTAFRGSAMQLVMQALGNHEASSAELDEIKALIAQIEKENKL
jgi:BlaI family transcriptional regulator, penicillinase repressor